LINREQPRTRILSFSSRPHNRKQDSRLSFFPPFSPFGRCDHLFYPGFVIDRSRTPFPKREAYATLRLLESPRAPFSSSMGLLQFSSFFFFRVLLFFINAAISFVSNLVEPPDSPVFSSLFGYTPRWQTRVRGLNKQFFRRPEVGARSPLSSTVPPVRLRCTRK